MRLSPTINHVYHLLQHFIKTKIDLIKLHYEYAPGNVGYESAKHHFVNNML